MKRQSASGISIVLTAACALLVVASAARASDQDSKSCTNRTLQGDYGYAAEGVLIGTPGLPPEAQFRSIGMIHFDGRGHLTWVEHTVVDGTLLLPDGARATGTYTVNSDCTGTTVVNTPNSPVPLNQHIVIVKRGREVHTLLDSSAITSVLNKVE
jgi:hypothetical protein